MDSSYGVTRVGHESDTCIVTYSAFGGITDALSPIGTYYGTGKTFIFYEIPQTTPTPTHSNS